jgi:transposase
MKKIIPLVIALANEMMNKLNVVGQINERVSWNESHQVVSPGNLIKALVLSTFTDMRIPLTHLEERLYPLDMAYLLGVPIEEGAVNESNVGRALQALGEADHEGIGETIALSAIQQYNVPVSRTHSDTTTLSFSGEYDIERMNLTAKEQESMLRIEHGYNKDGRPKDNQVVLGQLVTDTGIPLASKVMDGATSDIEWNKKALEYLAKIQKGGFKYGIYVADSKLVTHELVSQMNAPETHISFVSRCPANFDEKLEARMIKRAYESNEWNEMGAVGTGKKASTYMGQSFIETVCGHPVRLLVLESSALAEKSRHSLANKREQLMPLVKKTEQKNFACRADAEKEFESLVKKKKQNCSTVLPR